MDNTRIIVVEDNAVYCEYVCNLLAREGYRTVQAYRLSAAKRHQIGRASCRERV